MSENTRLAAGDTPRPQITVPSLTATRTGQAVAETRTLTPHDEPRSRSKIAVSATFSLGSGIVAVLGHATALLLSFEGIGGFAAMAGVFSGPAAVIGGIAALVEIGRSNGRLAGGGRAGLGIALGVIGVMATPLVAGLAVWGPVAG